MALPSVTQEYMQIPVVTRAYTTACVLTTLAVQLDLVSPFQLYFNPKLIVNNFQIWRVFTTFLFFGTLGFNVFFNVIFIYRYCRMLEEGSFRGRTADFVMFFIFGGVSMIILGFFFNALFLGHALTIMLVYVWARRNPYIRLGFFGLVNFQAPYLPWFLFALSVLLGNAVWVDLMGIAVGHAYFVLEDVFPAEQGGFKLLQTPQFLKNLCDPHPEDPGYTPLPEDRPGGFAWGAAADNQAQPQAQAQAQGQPQAQPQAQANPRNEGDQ